jgi:hypothetical protein
LSPFMSKNQMMITKRFPTFIEFFTIVTFKVFLRLEINEGFLHVLHEDGVFLYS